MKRKIRKVIYWSKTRRKFIVKGIKRRKYSIKIIIGIYNRTLDFESLLEYQLFQEKMI